MNVLRQGSTAPAYHWALKRLLDVTLGAVGLLLLAIPFLLISLAIKLDSRGPVFFRQARAGRGGRIIRVWKFRTMVHDPTRTGPQAPPAPNDPRVTRVGRVLRHFGVDEFPQLINVLRGEMSLVGPRPTLVHRAEAYGPRQRRRLRMKPGMTGWAQVNGRNRLSWDEKIEYDVWYIDHFTFWLDLRILCKTPWMLLRGEGVYMDPDDRFIPSERARSDRGDGRESSA